MSLDQELADLARQLKPIDPLASERVESLHQAILPGADPAGWVGVDVIRAINAGAVGAAVRNTLHTSHRLGRLERLRNVLALLPILLTWFGLMVSVDAYGDALRENPSLVETPFLLLWQQGFSGYGSPLASIFTLGHVALLDVFLIAIMISITWMIHSDVNVRQVQRERSAAELERRLHQAAWKAGIHLGNRSSHADRFDRLCALTETLLDEVKAERARIGALASERERHMADLRGFVSKFSTGTNDLRLSTDGLKGAFNSLESAINVADQRTTRLGEQEKILTESLSRFSTVAENTNRGQQQASAALDGAFTRVSDALQVVARASIESTANEGAMAAILAQLQSEFQSLREQFAQERQAYAAASTAASETAAAVTHALSSAHGVSRQLDESTRLFKDMVATVKTNFAATDQELSNVAYELAGTSRKLNELITTAHALTQANADLQRQAASALAQAPTVETLVAAWRNVASEGAPQFASSTCAGTPTRRRGLFWRS